MPQNNYIKTIIEGLERISDNYFLFEKEKKDIVTDFRGKAMEAELADAETRTRSAVTMIVNRMQSELDKLTKETEEGNNYADDAAIAATAQLLSKSGVSIEAAQKVIERFAGNQVALELLWASASDEIKPLFASYRFDNVGKLRNIRASVDSLNWESISNYPSIVSNIREGIQEFSRRQGIDLGPLSDTLQRMRMRNITLLMGLDPDKL